MADSVTESGGNRETSALPPAELSVGQVSTTSRRRRRDTGRLHTTRHGILSKHALEALRHLGEDVKVLRRMERRLLAALRPTGAIAELLFDRCFSSYLRCLLASRIEARRLMPTETRSSCEPSLLEREVPTLIQPEESEGAVIGATLPSNIFCELVLVQRYDRHFSREMFRSIAMLLVLRDSGEAGLEQCISQVLGVKKGGEG